MAFRSPMLPATSASSSPSQRLHLPCHQYQRQQPPSRLSLIRSSLPLHLRLRLCIPRPQLPLLPLALPSSGGGGGDGNGDGDGNGNGNGDGDGNGNGNGDGDGNGNGNGDGDGNGNGDGDGNGNGNGDGDGNGNGNGGGGGADDGASDGDYRGEALFVLAQVGRKLESLPADLAAAVEGGRVTGEIVRRFTEMEGSPLLRWLLQFRGFRERLLADDLFLAKLAMECGVGVIAKTAAEYEKRRENFVKEIDIVVADVVMAIVADFMLVYLPAPTVSLQPPLAKNAGAIANFFHNCPDNAFQIALAGRSYSLLQRLGAILRNGAKLFAVGTSASLVGTGVTNALIKARKAVDKELDEEVEDIPVVSTSVAYGIYMAVSSNLRYQVLSGVIEQRMLEPVLHNHKLLLSALCFAVRTGNTFLGSLLWVDYARLVGVQKVQEEI